MKKLRTLTLLLAALVALTANAQKMFTEVAQMKGVTSVFVGKTMLRLLNGHIGAEAGDAVDISKLASQLTSIEIIKIDDKKTINKARPLAERIVQQYPFEVLTEVNNDDTQVEIAGVFNAGGQTLSHLLIRLTQPDDMVYIMMTGDIDLQTLEDAMHKTQTE